MSLYDVLQSCRSEEDVKDAYIKKLQLKGVSRNLVDIQTKEIWFETKHKPHSIYYMFTQLLHYVASAYKKDFKHGEVIPVLLCVADSEKAAIMETRKIEPLLKDKDFKWGVSASKITNELVERVSSYIGTNFVQFAIKDSEDEFYQATKQGIKNGGIVRLNITPSNLKKAFDQWCELIGTELIDCQKEEWVLLFYADLMNDGNKSQKKLAAEVFFSNNEPMFEIKGKKVVRLASQKGYMQFWSLYNRPPILEFQDYLLERRDSLIPVDERNYKGAYYTPLAVVDKAYDYLVQTLGKNWQKDYFVWDMCCGVGNLESKHGNHRNLFMSTLDADDLSIIEASRAYTASFKFQYDYLNDDIDEDGNFNYNLTNKMPKELRDILQGNSRKKLLVLINPPYVEATSGNTVTGSGQNKEGVSRTKVSEYLMGEYGKSKNELFAQFMVRILKELPKDTTLALFSKIKYLNAQSFEIFRSKWTADFKCGFIVHSKAFDSLKGDFPISLSVWQLGDTIPQYKQLEFDVFSKKLEPLGCHTFPYGDNGRAYLNKWIDRPRTNRKPAIPMKNAIAVADKNFSLTTGCDESIGYMVLQGNDVQNANKYTFVVSSISNKGHGVYLTKDNLLKASITFAVRQTTKATWINDRSQFLQPIEEPTQEFSLDCLVYMLFHSSNYTTAINGLEWNGEVWNVVNHFMPFSEDEVNATGRFESNFMNEFLVEHEDYLSDAAKSVLNHARLLYQIYFKETDSFSVRNQLQINRPDVGWYQVRNALKMREIPTDFDYFNQAYISLTEKIKVNIETYQFLE